MAYNDKLKVTVGDLKIALGETKKYVDGKLAGVGGGYVFAGSVAFAGLPALTGEDAKPGNVYNVTDTFVTTTDFAEGAGIKCEAGTDVVIVEISDGEGTKTKKYNVFASYDLSTPTETEIKEMCGEIFGTVPANAGG